MIGHLLAIFTVIHKDVSGRNYEEIVTSQAIMFAILLFIYSIVAFEVVLLHIVIITEMLQANFKFGFKIVQCLHYLHFFRASHCTLPLASSFYNNITCPLLL